MSRTQKSPATEYGVPCLPSELVEPMLQHAIGMFFDEFERSPKDLYAAQRFWHKAQALSTLGTINGSTHASIVTGNWLSGVALLIEDRTGFDAFKWK